MDITLPRALTLLVSLPFVGGGRTPPPEIVLETCVLQDGTASPTWTEGIAVALWLHTETRRGNEEEVLRSTVRLGREAVLPLALRNIAPELRGRIEALMELR